MNLGSRTQRLALVGLQLAALWPSLPWLHARLTDGSGEAWGASAWLLALFALITRAAARAPLPAFGLPCALLLVYTASYAFCPPLVRAMIGVLSLAATISALFLGRRLSWPLAGLLLLGLPLEATLQFYLGYPLRFLVAEVSAPLLGSLGLDAVAQGTQLASSGLLVEVDGPCSGLKMLRMGLLCSCFVALRSGVGITAWAAHLALTLAALIAANVLRATSLFVLARLAEHADFWHAGTGVVAFAGVLALQLLAIRRLSGPVDVRSLEVAP